MIADENRRQPSKEANHFTQNLVFFIMKSLVSGHDLAPVKQKRTPHWMRTTHPKCGLDSSV